MTEIVTAVYDLMGKLAEPCVDDDTVKEKVDALFEVSIIILRIYKYNFCWSEF